MTNKLHRKLFLPPFFFFFAQSFAGQLPEDFKFEASSDMQRTSFISQFNRYEECNGNEKCIELLKQIENCVAVHIFIKENFVKILVEDGKNNVDVKIVDGEKNAK